MNVKFLSVLLLAMVSSTWAGAQAGAAMTPAAKASSPKTGSGGAAKVATADFGALPDGGQVKLYTLTDAQLEVKLISFGAHVTSVMAADRTGQKANVVLGYDTLAGYLADDKTYMGSIVGRYGNRIGKGTFPLEGQVYALSKNDHGNTLHGGTKGFDRMNWSSKVIPAGVEFTLVSKDGDMGFPGSLTAHVRYTLHGDALRIDYTATTDKATVVNLTNHSYFNLAGQGDILGEQLMIDSAKITPVDATLIPTGKYLEVAGTAFDFQTAHPIGERIESRDGEAGQQLGFGGGYDHNFVLKGAGGSMHLAAKVVDPGSGRTLTITTMEPGVQFYSGNFLDGTFHRASGEAYAKHDGFCLETQHFPDSPNEPAFPSTELKPGQTYRTSTVMRFSHE